MPPILLLWMMGRSVRGSLGMPVFRSHFWHQNNVIHWNNVRVQLLKDTSAQNKVQLRPLVWILIKIKYEVETEIGKKWGRRERGWVRDIKQKVPWRHGLPQLPVGPSLPWSAQWWGPQVLYLRCCSYTVQVLAMHEVYVPVP